jgi:hypothetical protein
MVGDSEGRSMSSIGISLIAFACVFGGAVAGMLLRALLPKEHLGPDSKEVVKVGMGLVATMAALVLGLLVASAKSSYDAQSTELTEMSSKVVVLDRILAHYGPETGEVREVLRGTVARILDAMWSKERSDRSGLEPSTNGEVLYDKIQGLSPKDDKQRANQAQALGFAIGLGQTRWLMYEQRASSVSLPLLVILVLWLSVIFVSFGLFAPPNATVVGSLLAAALSVSGAIFLIMEMYAPYAGLIQISSAPLRAALAHLGQ